MEESIEENKELSNKKERKKTPKKNKSNELLNTTKRKSTKKTKSPTNEIIGPLSKETIVLTGEFSISRDKFTNILKNFGAKVTGSVSSRTTILIHGDVLEDGRNFTEGRKYKTAIEKEVENIFSEDDFNNYMRKILKNNNWSVNNNDDNEKINIGKVSSNKKKSKDKNSLKKGKNEENEK